MALALGTTLLLPLPGTQSRERDFCRAWLRLSDGEKQDVVTREQTGPVRSESTVECRSGLSSGLRHRLDSECRNWRLLMDFEIRAIVDAALEPCEAEPRS